MNKFIECFGGTGNEQGKTILMVTHSQEASNYGNRFIYVRDGRISDAS